MRSQPDYINLTSGWRPLCQYYVVCQLPASACQRADIVNRSKWWRWSEGLRMYGLWADIGQAQQPWVSQPIAQAGGNFWFQICLPVYFFMSNCWKTWTLKLD